MSQLHVWILPVLILALTTILAIPTSRYLAWIMDGKYRAPAPLRWLESRLNTGPQDWKQYALALLLFNLVMFLFGYTLLALQPKIDLGLNPEHKGMLAPTTIFNTAVSFLDEHEPAALFGRAAPFLFQPDVLCHLEHVRFGERRPLRP